MIRHQKLSIILLLVSVFIAASAFAAAPPPTVSILDPRPGTSTVPTIVSLTGTGATPASAFKVQIQVWNDVADITGVAVGYCASTSDPNTLANFAWVAAGVNANYSCGTNCGIYEATVSGLPAGSYYLLARAVSTADGTGYSSDNRTGNDAKFTYIAVRLANATNKGTGMLLARDSSSQLCLDCHNLSTHSSQSTSSSYGNWQISCGECHTPHNTHNIYLVKDAITTPNSGSKNATFYNTTGDATNSYVNSAAGSGTTGVCQVCHTQTKDPNSSNPRWRNTGNSDPAHYQTGGANGTQRCTACHPHTSGFKGSCTMCHGNPPVDNSTLIGSVTTFGATGRATQNPPGAGAHATHVTTKGYGCSTCHTGGGSSGDHNKQTSPALVQIGFNLFSGAYQSGAYDAPAFSNTNYDLANGNAGTTVTKVGPSRACSNIYCHSKGQSNATFTGGNAPNLGAVWEGAMNATCSGCHGNDSGATYTISSGSHTKHVVTNNIGCVRCHSATVSGNRTISTQANHVNNLINVALDAIANPLGTATYNTVLSPMTKAPGSLYGFCTSISCHNDGRSVWNGTVGVGNTDAWGQPGTCKNCHGNAIYSDYRKAAPLYASTSTVPPGKPNAHDRHVDVRTTPSNEPQCKNCHSTVTASNTAIDGTTPTNHANSVYNVNAGSTYYDGDNVGGGYTTTVSVTYNYTANPTTSTCSNVSCHPAGTAGTKALSSTRWDTGYNCIDCHNINLTNTTGYHHAMNNTTTGYPTTIPDGDAASGTNAASRKCTMCHADHSIFSPMLNASSPGRSYNLRTDIAAAPTASSGYANSDYVTGGGICISCHSTERTKSATSVLAETSSTKTVAVPDTDFSGTSHNYNVASTMTNGGATFSANCTKCHNSKNNETTTFQNSTNKFGTHNNPLRRLLASLGIASPADPEEEDFCYRCHSKNTDAIGGTVKPAANNDWYGAVTNMTAASQDIYTAMQLGSAATSGTAVNASTLYMRNSTFTPTYNPPKPTAYLLASGTYTGTTTFTQRYIDTASGTTQETRAQTTGTTATRYLRYIQFVSPPLASSWTVASGSNFTVNIRRGVNAAAAVRTRIQVYRYTSAGANTPLSTTVLQDTVNWPTTAGNQAITFTTNTAVTFSAGDSLIVEIEAVQTNTTSATATLYWGNLSSDNASVVLPSSASFQTVPASPASGRHDVAAYSGRHKPSPTDETLAYISANKHVECDDCHNPHAAKAGNHTTGSNAVANVSLGVSGATPTYPGATYGTTASSTLYLRNNGTTNAVPPAPEPLAYQYSSGTYTTNTFTQRDMAPTSGATAATTGIANGTTVARYNRGLQFVSPQIDQSITIPSGSIFTLTIREYQGTGTGTNYTRFTVYKWNGTTATPFNTSAAPNNFAQNTTAITTTQTNRSLAFTSNQAVTLNPGDSIICDVEFYHATGTTAITVTYAYGNFGTDAAALALPAGTYVWRTSQSSSGWLAPSSYSLQAATHEYEICFKCHSSANANVTAWGTSPPTGSLSWTDLGLEFNPNNESYHPVVQALPTTGNRRLASTALTGGWVPGGVMTCSDCHDTDSTASTGPHGSSVKWMLNPNTTGTKYYNWPYTTVANNGTNGTANLLMGTGSTTVPTNNFCFSCHVWSGGGAAHTQQGNSHGAACVECHIRVPHGGKVLRLLNGENAPLRYRPDGASNAIHPAMNGGTRPASGTMGQNNCTTNPSGQCGNQHSAAGQTW